jgi:hypothetical protein
MREYKLIPPNTHEATVYGVGNLGPSLRLAHKCVQVFNWLTGSQFLLDNWISNIYKQTMLEKTSTYLLPLKEKKRPHTIIKMNDNINMDSTAGSIIACI